MRYLIFFIIYSLLIAQNFSWSKINEINEGWDYLSSTNTNYDAIAVGIDLEGYNPMQIYFRENNHWQQIPGNNLAGSMAHDLYLADNQFTGTIPESICNIDLDWGGENNWGVEYFNIWGNDLCPPYPDCLNASIVGNQVNSLCGLGDVDLRCRE